MPEALVSPGGATPPAPFAPSGTLGADPVSREDALMPRLRWPQAQPTLGDGDLVLRPSAEIDVPSILLACQDAEIQRWATIPVPYRLEDAVDYVTAMTPTIWRERQGAGFVVCDGSGRLLGSCGLVRVDAGSLTGDIGYWVAPWARGRGVAAQATRIVRDWALAETSLTTLRLLIEPGNAASHAVARAVGAVRDDEAQGACDVRGELQACTVYALPASG